MAKDVSEYRGALRNKTKRNWKGIETTEHKEIEQTKLYSSNGKRETSRRISQLNKEKINRLSSLPDGYEKHIKSMSDEILKITNQEIIDAIFTKKG